MSIFNSILILLIKPYEDRKSHYTELFNELTIFYVGLHLYLFTEYLDEPE
jgi:hypothetical protein